MLGYVIGVGAAHKVELVQPAADSVDPWSHEISGATILTWKNTQSASGQTMEEPWSRTSKRLLKHKRFFLIQAPRPSVSPLLAADEVANACAVVGLKPPSDTPKRRIDYSQYTVSACGHPVSLRFRDVAKFMSCPICNPPEQAATREFLEFLQAAGLTCRQTLSLQAGSTQVDRSQLVTVECLACGGSNVPRSYDNVRYRGFRYCDNPACEYHYPYPEYDVVGKGLEAYVQLFKRHGIKASVEAQQLFPFVMQHLKVRFAELAAAMGWHRNHRGKPDVTKLRIALNTMIEAGARRFSDFLCCPDPALRSELIKARQTGLLQQVLTEIGFIFKQTPQIKTLDDARDFIVKRRITSWTQAASGFPKFASLVIELGVKDELFSIQGWSHRRSYCHLPDSDLLQHAIEIFDSEEMQKIDDLERRYSGLITEIRRRKLSERLRKDLELESKVSWVGRSYDEVIKIVQDGHYVSSTELHKKLPGLYKYIAANNWLKPLPIDMEWGRLKDCQGASWQSYAELIVANLLHLNGLAFEPHPRIFAFSGQSGGRPMADMAIVLSDGSRLWVEIWAFASAEDAGANTYFDGAAYWQNRLYKERMYTEHGLINCAIEGRLYYQPLEIDGIRYAKGLESFVAHTVTRLRLSGVKVDANDGIIDQIREACSRF